MKLGPLVLALLVGPAHAGTGVWAGQILTADLDPEAPTGPQLWLDLAERQTGANGAYLIRPAVGWALSKHASVWLGGGWGPSITDGAVTHEIRPWQQLVVGTKAGSIALLGRFRQEQRMFVGQPDVVLRSRFMARAAVPIGDDGFGLVAFEEFFVRLTNTTNTSAGFDSNRAFLGPYVSGGRGVRIETGYLSLVVGSADGLVTHHLAAANLFIAR